MGHIKAATNRQDKTVPALCAEQCGYVSKPMKKRNYTTLGRRLQSAAIKSGPSVPKLRASSPRGPKYEYDPDVSGPRPDAAIGGHVELLFKDIVWRTEEQLGRDPALPPSRRKLEDYPAKKLDDLPQAIKGFRAAGFLPNAVSRLIDLRPADISKLLEMKITKETSNE